ncbi:phage tail length tape measure family protein, partial [Chromobacterium piscinae]
KATGESTDSIVSDFEKISAKPVDAITALNDQYHFLTLCKRAVRTVLTK